MLFSAPGLAMLLRVCRSRGRTALRAAASLGLLAALSACAGGQHISSTQEASQYEQRAHHSYAPPGPRSDPWGPYVVEASTKFDVPQRWIREVMHVESGGHVDLNGSPITSPAGAMGLMQVMPATYDELRGRYSVLGDDPYDPYNSIMAGTAYIRELYDLYGSPGFLAAYNSGPGRLDDYLTRNRPLPDETRRYVAMIGPQIANSFPNKRSTAEEYALNSVPANIPAGPRYAAAPAYNPPAPSQPSPPVEVAYAPPSDSDAAFDPPPGWTPRGMPRDEVATYVPPPGNPPRVLAPSAPPVQPTPVYREPAVLAQNEPPPSSVYSPAPVRYRPDSAIPVRQEYASALPPPAPRPEPRYEQPAAPPLRSEPPARAEQYAALPEPPSYVPAVRTASATGYAALAQNASHHEQEFRLVPPAMAAAAPYYRGTTPSQWAIQVGAFGNEGLAHIAVGTAREQAGSVVAGAHLAVASIHETHGTLYRARLTGLSREAATTACERLRGRESCMVLAPDAQD